MKIKTREMLRQTVVILIGKYQLKEKIMCVVFQQVFYTTTTTLTISAGIDLSRMSSLFFMDDLISRDCKFNQIFEEKNLDL